VDEWEPCARRLLCAAVVGVCTAFASVEAGEPMRVRVKLGNLGDSALVAEVVRAAARRLENPRCHGLLDEFIDGAGRPLRERVVAEDVTPSQVLERIFFAEGARGPCALRQLAYTTPGSRVVYVCSRRFRKMWAKDRGYVTAVVIHEALHTLGLGENPPAPETITARVLDRCRP